MVLVNKQEADQSKKHRKLHFSPYFGIKKTDWYFLTVDRSPGLFLPAVCSSPAVKYHSMIYSAKAQ